MKGLKLAGLGLAVAAAAVLVLIAGVRPSSQVSAEDDAVSIGSATVAVGEQGSVDLEALNVAAPGLGGWDIAVAYDSAVVSAVDCDDAGASNVLCDTATAGTVRAAGISGGGLEGDTTLATITFQCDAEGESDLTLTVSEFTNAALGDPQPIDVSGKTTNGSITCGVAATPTATEVPVTPTATEVPVTPTATEVPVTPTPVPTCLVGDVDDDGEVNSIDAALILQLEVELIDVLPAGETCP